ncbi:DUF7619 domain-containing protein [Xanthomarina gelatinilytica]|nr:leucine-rich repeat domain-containing protein [Xanthomarina gelatinilytica]
MKHSYLFLMTFLVFSFSQAQIVNIPDANFKDALVNTDCADLDGDGFYESDVDTNNDGEIQVSEALAALGLRVSNKNISSIIGIEMFVNLRELDCSNNSISTISINSLSNLNYLDCEWNNLTELNVTNLTNLNTLVCNYNQLTTIDLGGLSSLAYLYVNYNQFTSLDVRNLSGLERLKCSSNNQLTSLEVSGLPNLFVIECNFGQLTSLDLSGLTGLGFMEIENHELSTLDLSDLTSLIELRCSNNQITSLDVSELTQLRELVCDNNQVTTIDLTNARNLVELRCSNNQLTSLYLKNGSETLPNSLSFDSNPNLEYICVDERELNNVQYLVNQEGLTNCVVNSYCSFVPGGMFYTIQGDNKLDIDSNGCNSNDPVFPNLKLNRTNNSGNLTGVYVFDNSGNYNISAQYGTHTITPILENPTYFTVTPASLVVNFPTDASPYNQDFCLVPNGVHNDLEITILPIEQARPGFDTGYKIIYRNKGNTELSGSVNLMFQDDVMDLVSANPTADNQVLNELSWNFSNLLPFESREITFTMNLNTPTDTPPLNGDDVLMFTATANPVSGDEMPEDNEFILNQTVVNSFDPNDKTCLGGEIITPEQVGKFVHYMIRFENTGTASAVNIVVKDDIDLAKYDVTTLIPLNGSHDFVTRIKEDNVVEFIFENINLPFDDANNDGYVLFKIKTLPSLVLGDTFSNDAEIYFDYNAPIITNDELTTVAENLSIEESILQTTVKIYPNPVSDELTIDSKGILETISIFDVNGRQLQTFVIGGSTNKSKININMLSKGVYFVSIKTETGIQISKIIKE